MKVFEKKDSERMLTRKAWDHAIDLREGFVPKKGKIYPLSRVEREEVLQSMSPRDSMEKGKEYDDIIGCAVSSLS